MNLSLSRTLKASAKFLFAFAVLLSSQAQAQSIVGSWTVFGISYYVMTFQSNGRWSFTDSDPADMVECGGSPITVGGGYTTSGGTFGMSIDSAGCGSATYSGQSTPFLSGSYSISGSTLTVTSSEGSFFLTSLGASTVTPSTPLPPPPATQTVFAVPSGQMPAAAVQVTPSGSFGSATLVVKLDLSKVLSAGLPAGEGQFAAGYNIYVGALVPAGVLGLPSTTWFAYPASKAWAPLGFPIAPYLEGISQDATNAVEISILQGMDVTGLVGAEIYIGYGISSDEMLEKKRYRGVYQVQ